MTDRFTVSDELWLEIQRFIPNTWKNKIDPRDILNGILWKISTNLRWEDFPEEYGDFKVIRSRFIRWRRLGVFQKILHYFLEKPEYRWMVTNACYLINDDDNIRKRVAFLEREIFKISRKLKGL